MTTSPITTHVLDTSIGRPGADVRVVLYHLDGARWTEVGRGMTDADGRLRTLVGPGAPAATGMYRMTFETGAYFASRGAATFFPLVEIVFQVAEGEGHYHVPLLVSPFGYSTYRGS